MNTKQDFIKKAIIICDTRERSNGHITRKLDELGVKYESKKLDVGDYSFIVDDKDFSMSCVIERKANVDELWGNITKERERFEKELSVANSMLKSFTVIIESVADWEELKAYRVPSHEILYQGRKIENIGEYVHNTLESWSSANRYNFKVRFTDRDNSACKMLDIFYWFWRNYKEILRPISRK